MHGFSETLRIIDAGLRRDPESVISYATLLADKLESSGDERAAKQVRNRLNKNSGDVLAASASLPVDGETRFDLADQESFVQVVPVALSSGSRHAVEEFLRHALAADELVKEGLMPLSSIIVHGPPGCGKTQLAKHIASRLDLPLLTARSDAMISSYLGSTAKNVRHLFEHAARRPCVLFLDEFDALAKQRDDRQELGELKRVVVSLLQNIDALRGRCILVAATNHAHLLDPAVWRRFSYHVEIGFPDRSVRQELIRSLVTSLDKAAIDRLTDWTDGLTGSAIKDLVQATRRESFLARKAEPEITEFIPPLLARLWGARDAREVSRHIVAASDDRFSQVDLASAYGVNPSTMSKYIKQAKSEFTP